MKVSCSILERKKEKMYRQLKQEKNHCETQGDNQIGKDLKLKVIFLVGMTKIME